VRRKFPWSAARAFAEALPSVADVNAINRVGVTLFESTSMFASSLRKAKSREAANSKPAEQGFS